ncbi:hypothetical protein [Actinophytocola sediminis]
MTNITGYPSRRYGGTDVRITLVNASERFAERLRLHQVASGQRLADLQIPELLANTGRITILHNVANPDKLRTVATGTIHRIGPSPFSS